MRTARDGLVHISGGEVFRNWISQGTGRGIYSGLKMVGTRVTGHCCAVVFDGAFFLCGLGTSKSNSKAKTALLMVPTLDSNACLSEQ